MRDYKQISHTEEFQIFYAHNSALKKVDHGVSAKMEE